MSLWHPKNIQEITFEEFFFNFFFNIDNSWSVAKKDIEGV